VSLVPEPVVLEGRHVRLEPLRHDHAAGLAAAAAEDRSSYRYTTVPESVAEAAAYVDVALAAQRTGTELPFATCRATTGEVIGSTRFLDLEYWDGGEIPTVAEVGGTWLAASAQRTACNREAKLLMLGHAFETWGARRVHLKTDARNERSRAAIARLGARFEGIRRAHMPAADGGIRDSAYYSILAAEWPEVRARLLG
jgi:RimJ/RimL family protein N-acetyltransferase